MRCGIPIPRPLGGKKLQFPASSVPRLLSTMATVLSRALKLPGKKNHDLGEYDPLTQADSDESEDDLVTNIQKNGLKNGKSNLEERHEPDSDVEVGLQKSNQRVSKHSSEGLSASGGSFPEQKVATSVVPCLRTAAFLLTVLIAMVLVLVCAFLIPCPQTDLLSKWSLHLGQRTGALSPLELFDVNKDGVPDILLSFTACKNDTMQVASRPVVTVLALSGINGSVLWTIHIPEEIRSIQCGRLFLPSVEEPTCLLTGISSLLRLVRASSGKVIWTMSPAHIPSGTVTAPSLILPDLDEDDTSDLLVLMIVENQPGLTFLMISGRMGKPLGGPVKYDVQGEGILVGPHIHITSRGAYYVLFGFGNIQAVALRDIFAQAKNRDKVPRILQEEDPDWQKKSVNLSERIDVYSGGVQFVQSVSVPENNCSDLLITTKRGLSLVSGQDLEPRWILKHKNIQSQPALGYFNEDRSLDFMLQVKTGNRTKKVMVINGKTGTSVWNFTVPWQTHESKAVSVLTADMKSVFLFWGEEPHPESNSSVPGIEERKRHHLYLLHPTYPNVLLDLMNSTVTVTTTAIGINDLQKDAFYVTATTEYAQGTSRDCHGPLAVGKLGLRWGMANSNVTTLGAMPPKIKPGDVRRILARLKFVSQNQKF